MIGRVATKATRMARGTALATGVAVMLALVVGVSTTALAGTGVGAHFDLGKTNTVNQITKLVGSVAGPPLQVDNNSTNAAATALDLQVEPGKAPMKVNSDAQVANLNSDKLDGKSANEIGINCWEKVEAVSARTSNSSKIQAVSCPAGKVVVGTGYGIGFGSHGGSPNEEADVVVTNVDFGPTSASVQAYEEEPTSNTWQVHARAICATAP